MELGFSAGFLTFVLLWMGYHGAAALSFGLAVLWFMTTLISS
jgi:hypothetical protein